ncbi:MAG: Zn-binding domain-containing protein, partial [Halodesulfovibrio sp.]
IGILPLLVMTDRNDLGGISTPMHAQVGKPAVFIYDGMPGGAGLTRLAFERAQDMFERTLAVIRDCGCELGCPSCVHSPKCGSGNRPIDKAGALDLLLRLGSRDAAADEQLREQFVLQPVSQNSGQTSGQFRPAQFEPTAHSASALPENPDVATPPAKFAPAGGMEAARQSESPHSPLPAGSMPLASPSSSADSLSVPKFTPARYAVLDVETQLSAQEVGGWNRAERMRVSVAVLYDSATDAFTAYTEDRMPEMLKLLEEFELVVGFNILRFDYKVLSAYTTQNLANLPTLDMLDVIRKRLSYRVSLDNLGSATFDAPKSADGLQALKWWKEGKVDEIARYCEQDVRITRDLYLHGREHGYVLFTNKAKQKVRILVDW